MEILTEKQHKVLQVIKDFFTSHGTAPSLNELREALNIKTKRGVVNHLTALEKKGVIERSSNARGITLVESIAEIGDSLLSINILGAANAGMPMVFANTETMGTLRVDRSLLPIAKDIFALEIKGDSMNKREINGIPLQNGYFAIIAKNTPVESGDVVLAIIDECATIKSIKKDKRMMVLYPESTNKLHRPMYLGINEGDSIAGKVIAVLENPIF